MTYAQAVNSARSTLVDAGISADEARRDATLLARDAAEWSLDTWVVRRHESVSENFAQRFAAAVARRRRREPVAYIRGVQEFWGREFLVSPAVLIPRPETELLVELARERLAERTGQTVVDVGTGSGCLAVSLTADHPALVVDATDISADALALARQNATRHGVAQRIRFHHNNYLGTVPPADLVVCNPPYVAERDRATLPPEVRDYEPSAALFGGNDGWRDIRALLGASTQGLRPGGYLLLEVGAGQAEQLPALLQGTPRLVLHETRGDLQGIGRAVVIRRQR